MSNRVPAVGRPVESEMDEIVITPDMIKAGKDALDTYHPDFDNVEDKAIEIFCAMLNANNL